MKSKLILCFQCCLFAAFAISCGETDDKKPSEPEQSCANENEMMCDDNCVDIKSNDKYCGSCDNSCDKDEHCDDGTCQKAPLACDESKGELKCGDACINVTANNEHCGACNHKCEADEICTDKTCQKKEQDPQVPECKTEEGETLCWNTCVNITNDVANCGECSLTCGQNMTCENKVCTCIDGFEPISDDVTKGCIPLLGNDCKGDETRECWTFDIEPAEGSPCKKGVQHCMSGIWEESCDGQVGPRPYDPASPEADLNCNGTPDQDEDLDGDGFTKADGDCCDDLATCSATKDGVIQEQDLPSINPGASELPGDKVDNNCNGQVDETPETSCDHAIDENFPKGIGEDAALALARAMDICDEVVTRDSRKPGLISASLLDGMKEVSLHANAFFTNAEKTYKLRPVNSSKSFAVLSTGKAIDAAHFDDTSINSKDREVATSGMGTIPKLYSQSDPNFRLQSNALCGSEDKIYDVAALTTEMRVPSNAKGFSIKFRFFTSEYSEYVCKPFNDFFVILLESQHKDTPADHNIAFDLNHNPISVNNAFFTSCVPLDCEKNQCPAIMPICEANAEGKKVCKSKNAKGETVDPCSDGEEGRLAASTFNTYAVGRGATSWLETSASVVSGEVIRLHFYIWDTKDSSHDSLVILDDFQWIYEDVELGTLPVVIN